MPEDTPELPVVVEEATPIERKPALLEKWQEEPQPAALAVPDPQQPAAMAFAIINKAIDRGVDVAMMERLLAMQERIAAQQAARDFTEAVAEFKRNAPTIRKDKLVEFETQGGGKTSYTHATIGNVVEVITSSLARYGLSHRWEVDQTSDPKNIRVTCYLTHRSGHSEQAVMMGEPDASGRKNPIQQRASTVTYLMRYTLLAVTGLATRDQEDDDGKASGDDPSRAPGIIRVDGKTKWQNLIEQWENVLSPLMDGPLSMHAAKGGEPAMRDLLEDYPDHPGLLAYYGSWLRTELSEREKTWSEFRETAAGLRTPIALPDALTKCNAEQLRAACGLMFTINRKKKEGAAQ